MALTIDTADRVTNKYVPIDATDKTELNADNVMIIVDGLANGKYRSRVYNSANSKLATTGELGELFFCTDDKQMYFYDGTAWKILG